MSSYLLYILVLIPVFVILVVLSSFLRRKNPNIRTYNYQKKEYLITKSEHDFFNILSSILGNRYYVFPQIHMSSLLEHKIKGQNWKGALSHIDRKSVDYVICDKEYLSPLLAIELDDETHQRSDRQERDETVEQILKNSNLPLIRIQNTDMNNIEEIKRKIEQILQ